MRILRVALLAPLLLGVAAIVPGEEAPGLLRQWERKLASPDPALRQRAIEVLTDLLPRPEEAAPALVARLADEHPAVRASASDALVRLGAAALPALLAALDSDDDALRLEAVRTLGRLGAAANLEPLAGMLDDDDPLVRAAVLDALSEVGDDVARPLAEKIAARLSDEDVEVRSAAVQALTRLDVFPPTALPALKRLAETEGDSVTRQAAALAATAIDPEYGLPAPLTHDEVNAVLAAYIPAEGISGTLRSVGADDLNNLMTLWAEGFREFYPNVTIDVQGAGNSTAPPALTAGNADLGPMNRPMRQAEVETFEKEYGYKPTALLTALDMVAVLVHRSNPLEALTLPQVDAIFSSTRNLGYEKDIRNWGDVGLRNSWERRPIRLIAHYVTSGAFGFFKEHALANGEFKDDAVTEGAGSTFEDTIGGDRYAIDYRGLGNATRRVRAVPLALNDGSRPVAPTRENAYRGAYPLTRQFYVYVNARPNGELPLLQREFLRYIFSREGQAAVVHEGFIPVTADMAAEALESVGAAP